jgi:hypothetical protein
MKSRPKCNYTVKRSLDALRRSVLASEMTQEKPDYLCHTISLRSLRNRGWDMKPVQAKTEGVMRKIVDFHLDEDLDWVAELECGHPRQVRHKPPWTCLACRRAN